MFVNLRYLLIFLLIFVFLAACSDSKKSNGGDDLGIDADGNTDGEIVITDSDESEDPDYSDADNSVENDETIDEDADMVEPVSGIKGYLWVEDGSAENKEVSLYECGSDTAEASVNTDENGHFKIEAELVKGTPYCVESGEFFSCFIAASESHTANINPITQLVYDLSQTAGGCDKLRYAETQLRNYMKIGTGSWLGELDYNELTGVQDGFESVKGVTSHQLMKDLLSDIKADILKESDREFFDFFNGFQIVAEKDEVIIDNATSPVALDIAGDSVVTAPGFKIEWVVINEENQGATDEIWSDDPGEFTARAYLYEEDQDVYFAQSSASVTFYAVSQEGSIDISDMSADFSYWVSDGAVAVFASGTEVTNDGNSVNEIGYQLLTSGGSGIAKVVFSPSGTIFTNDPMFFIIDLGLVFSGDPIMLGVERNDGAGEISVMNQASGDPIMLAASGDPIMFTASGDPIMDVASGDPIMGGNMSNVLVTSTNHFSDFTVKRKDIPLDTAEILDRWNEDAFSLWSPYSFISEAISDYKTDDPQSLSQFFVDRDSVGRIEGDIDSLFNMQTGRVKNLHILENYFYISSMLKGFETRKTGTGSEKYAAVYDGFDIRNAIYKLYLGRFSPERSVTADDLFDKSLLPGTFEPIDRSSLPDIRSLAAQALLGISESDLNTNLIVTKKDALDLLNFVTVSGGPNFGTLTGLLTPDNVLCVWLSGKGLSECKSTPVSFAINDEGRVEIDGTEVTETQMDVTFSVYFYKELSEISLERKHNLFRTLYLIIKYAANLYEEVPAVTNFSGGIEKMVSEMFNGMETDEEVVKIIDSIENSDNTVSVTDASGNFEIPMFSDIFDFLEKVKVSISSDLFGSEAISNVVVRIHGHGYTAKSIGKDERPGYKIDSDKGYKTFSVSTPNTSLFAEQPDTFTQNLAVLFSDQDMNVLGDCVADVSVILFSVVDGKKYVRTKDYSIAVGSLQDAESNAGTLASSSRDSELSVILKDSNGNSIETTKGKIMLMPGNIVLQGTKDGSKFIVSNLKPAMYVVEGWADGYYPVRESVVINEGVSKSITLYLTEKITGTDTSSVTINFNKIVDGGIVVGITSSEFVTVAILDEHSEIIKQFENVDASSGLSVANLKYGQYTLKVVSDYFYTFIGSMLVKQATTETTLILKTKNICGNGIIESGEECDGGSKSDETETSNIQCGDIYSDAVNPENTLSCNSCTYTSDPCYTISK